MIEHERSYVFTIEEAEKFITDHDLKVKESLQITDRYFCKGLRLRDQSDQKDIFVVRKMGDKAKGYRTEDEEKISREAANLICDRANFVVQKERRVLSHSNEYATTMDFVELPMRLAILEIESLWEVAQPIPIDITKRLFDVELRDCPLSAHQLFNRNIAFAGGPSSGKTETAKGLSHELNTTFGANSFHVAEYATTFIQKYGRGPNLADQFFVWHGQSEREHNADAANIVISDCPTFLTYIYAQIFNDAPFDDRMALFMSKMYKRCLFEVGKYTDIFFMELQEYKDNGVRFQTHEEARDIENRIKRFLDDHKIPYIPITYNDASRIIPDLFFINE